jgi:hypothetical protein
MSTLGEILDRLNDPAQLRELMVEEGDLLALAGLDAAEDACALALRAVDDFSRQADSEAWVKLIGRIQDSDAPAQACLSEMLHWARAH